MAEVWAAIRDKLERDLEGHGKVAEFCRKAGLNRRTVDYWIKGDQVPGIDKLAAIAEGLKTSPAKLVGGTASEHDLEDCLATVTRAVRAPQPSPALNPELARLFSDLDESQVTELIPMIQALLRGFDPREQEQTVKPRKKS